MIIPVSNKNSSAGQWQFTDGFGSAVLPAAVVMDVRVTSGGLVVSESVEKGSFATYNKVNEPIEINTTLAFEGTDICLQSVLENIEKLKQALTHISIATPIHEYENMSLQNYEYQLSATDGLGVLYINALFVEVREVEVVYSTADVASISQADASNPADVSVQDNGIVSAENPTASQQAVGESAKPKRTTFAYDVLGKVG